MLGLGQSLMSASALQFSLADISGLTAWYKFNEGIFTTESTVTLWNDSSGNDRHMGNITATNDRPAFDSSDNTVNFADDKYLELNSTYGTDTNFPNSNEFTFFAAVRIPFNSGTTQINAVVVGQGTSDNVSIGNLNFLTGSYYAFSGNASDSNYQNTVSTETTYPHVNNELFVIAVRRAGTKLEIMRNARANVISSTTESNTSATFDLNTLSHNTASSKVSIAELAVYNSGLSDDDFDLVINDIKTRVGI